MAIFTIIDAEVKISKSGSDRPYIMFKVEDDYHEHYFMPVAVQVLYHLERFNGISFGERELFVNEYIGYIISAEKKREQFGNKWFITINWWKNNE